MNKKILSSVREYRKQSVLAPILVILEVLMEVLIPLEMAKIIDVGIANGDMSYIIQRGVILVVMAMLSLFFGVQAGNMAAVAAAGYAKNLRHTFAVYFGGHNRYKTAVCKRQYKAQRRHSSATGIQENICRNVSADKTVYMRLYRLFTRAFVDMDFVAYYVVVSLKYSKYRDRIFRVLLLLFCVVPGGHDIHAIRKIGNRFTASFKVLPVVVVKHSGVLLIL